MIRYYKKLSPSTKILVGPDEKPTGQIEFTTLNGVLGYFATDQEFLQNEFERFMRAQRYGVTEISAEEFHRDYVQKKTSSELSPKSWREEISGSSLLPRNQEPVARVGSEQVQAAVGVSGTDIRKPVPIGTAMVEPSPAPAAKAPVTQNVLEQFRPATGTRKPKKT